MENQNTMSAAETKKQLEVGDMIYPNNYGSYGIGRSIDRVTAKRAFAGDLQFDRELKPGCLRQIGGYRYEPNYYLETQKILDAVNEKQDRYAFSKLINSYETWPIEKVRCILSAIQSYPRND